MKKKLALLFGILFIFISAVTAHARPAWYEWAGMWFNNATTALEVNGQVPLYLGETLEGKATTLKDYDSKVILLSFWATWCPPCIKELPDLSKLQNSFKKEDFQIATIAVHTDRAELDSFLIKHPIDLPILHDNNDEVAHSYGILYTPTGIIVDSSGKILRAFTGPINLESAKKEISYYLQNMQN